ncbi:MAG: hypothetical protein LBI76_12630, partial [Comamonas sp.]|nr:hypothetical protein [Comamonas sp.]
MVIVSTALGEVHHALPLQLSGGAKARAGCNGDSLGLQGRLASNNVALITIQLQYRQKINTM